MTMIFRKPQIAKKPVPVEEPDMLVRVIAALAVLAWLMLAGDALAQGTNQWATAPAAPLAAPLQTPVAEPAQPWSSGDMQSAPVYAPADLEQRLSDGTMSTVAPPAAVPAAPATPAPAGPVYAPAGTATSTRPARQTAPAVAPGYGAAPAQTQQPYGYQPQPYGYGAQAQPYGALPQLYGYPGQTYGYALPMTGYPFGLGAGGYPGIAPAPGGWGGYPGAYTTGYPGGFFGPGSGYGGIPFFGGSPFGFW